MTFNNTVAFWHQVIKDASKVDHGDSVPELNEQALSVWGGHYHLMGSLTMPDSDFLEIGTGFGVLAAGIAKLSSQKCIAVEHPSRSYFYSKQYMDFLNRHSVSMAGCDIRTGLPFNSCAFSTIYLCDVIEHLQFEGVRTVLCETMRVLKPGGRLIITTPNLNRLSNILRFLRGYSPNPPLYAEYCGETLGHIREFAHRELHGILEHHGFAIDKVTFGGYAIFSLWQKGLFNRLNRLICGIVPCLRDEIYIVARKPKILFS